MITQDHVIPRSKGGINRANLIAAHPWCNTQKGNRNPTGCELIWLDMVNTKMGFVK